MSPPTPGEPAAPLARADRRVLLILRTPPPYGGGEVIGQQLEQLFAGRFSVLTFRRSAHDKQRQGRLSFSNVAFGVGYVVRSALRIVQTRPRVVYVDLPKDRLSFTRTSGILLAALAVRARVVGDLAGAEFEFLRGRGWMRSYGRALLRRLYAIRVLGPSVADGLARHGLRNTVCHQQRDRRPGRRDPGASRARGRGEPIPVRRQDRRGEGNRDPDRLRPGLSG